MPATVLRAYDPRPYNTRANERCNCEGGPEVLATVSENADGEVDGHLHNEDCPVTADLLDAHVEAETNMARDPLGGWTAS